jgi:hypothetical protein
VTAAATPLAEPSGYRYERVRYEMKYPVRFEQASQMLAQLRPYLQPDAHGQNGQYVIYSVYFDTPNLDCYYEKLDGFANRVKFRLRTYLGTGNPVWFLESKERVRHYIAKHRVRLTADQADRLLQQHLTPGTLQGIVPPTHPLMLKLAPTLYRGIMQPVVAVYYHRHAYTFYGARDVRITLDHNLVSLPGRVTTATLPQVLPTQFTDSVLLEIKGNGFMPQTVVQAICNNQLVARSFSKYCVCLEQLRPYSLPKNIYS